MHVGIISLFPEMFSALNYGITGRAISGNYLKLAFWNPRDFVSTDGDNNYKAVDDRPYGGGPGMVMKSQPVRDAIKAAKTILGPETSVIHLSPQGTLLTQNHVVNLAKNQCLILLASRYEGIDERLLEAEVDQEWSIGDYVLTGGELPAMVFIDAISRFIPGVLGHQDSAAQDSFMNGLLDCPHYTRPEDIEGHKVPKVLLEGNHQLIAQWRLKQSLGRTWLRRPDLLAKRGLTPGEEQLLNEFINEYQEARGNSHE